MSDVQLLIDADVLAYEAASSKEKAVDWGGGYWTWHCDFNEVEAAFWDRVAALKEKFDTDDVKLCLTDSEGNFRRSVLPTYKGNRSSVKKPLVLQELKRVLIDDHGAYFRPGLEGDDCMGILSTMPNPKGTKRIIVSIDKDMETIPGFWTRDGSEVSEVSVDQADYRHMLQTVTGDQTDGYGGCPGIGPKRAAAILDPLYGDLPAMWAAVVTLYEGKKLTEEYALRQARVARILRATDYDFKKKEPILWEPPRS